MRKFTDWLAWVYGPHYWRTILLAILGGVIGGEILRALFPHA